MSAIRHFSDVRVFESVFSLQQEVFELNKHFPRDEAYSLTTQVRRSSRSVGANVVEAWHKRRYEAQFVYELSDADAELAKTEHWLQTALACRYIERRSRDRLVREIRQIGAKLGAMMADTSSWTRAAR